METAALAAIRLVHTRADDDWHPSVVTRLAMLHETAHHLRMSIDSDSAKVWPPPPLVYLAGLGIGLVLHRLADGPGLGLSLLAGRSLGGLLSLLGAGLLLWASGLFRRVGSDVRPWKPTTVIVDSGIYAVTRNPMYLGMALLHAGIALALDNLIALLMLLPVLLWIRTRVIAREETYLEGKFGDDYRRYRQRVRRWL
jgi:protein-S-isoprenylcysteine O-methyltransferase Ste14